MSRRKGKGGKGPRPGGPEGRGGGGSRARSIDVEVRWAAWVWLAELAPRRLPPALSTLPRSGHPPRRHWAGAAPARGAEQYISRNATPRLCRPRLPHWPRPGLPGGCGWRWRLARHRAGGQTDAGADVGEGRGASRYTLRVLSRGVAARCRQTLQGLEGWGPPLALRRK